jgi:hypothetical protein
MDAINKQQALTLEIERARGEIVEGLLEEMYQNPFWDARFGERGRIHTRRDTNFHLNYLISALELHNPASLVTYYHWLQGLLVYRGMCTLHLRQTINSLGHQISRLLPDAWPGIQPYHQASYEGLYYDHHDCQALVAAQAEIARATAKRMFTAAPAEDPATLERRQQDCYQDNLYYLSYLADAVAYNSIDIFTRYITWLKTFFPTHNLPVEELLRDLQVLSEEVQQALGEEHARTFTTLLAKAV